MNDIQNYVLTIIAEKIGASKDTTDVNDNLFADLNASKLEKAEIIASLEEKYHITFDIEELSGLNTPLGIIEYIEDNVE
ncbi:acyl carrier protein [Candidatus Gottesmanbacteria bacterium]|nr:acyl carrier protein [Candidatus Gottesmanbacteria bacterium]